MDRTGSITFEKGEKVRLLRDYPEYDLKKGRRGTFLHYWGEGAFATVQFGKIQPSIQSFDLEKVPVKEQPQFQHNEIFRLKRKWGTYQKGHHGTFMNYGPGPHEATVRMRVNAPLEQIPITYLEKRAEA